MNIQRIITLLFLALFISACADGTDDVDTGGDGNSGKPGSPPDTSLSSDINPTTAPYSKIAVTVTLSCIDSDGDCDKIYYSLDGTDPTQDGQHQYSMPFTISTLNAVVEIRYFSVDLKGNRETTIQSTTYTMDATSPSYVTPIPNGGSFSVAQYVKFDCQDTLSGCKTIRFSTDPNLTDEEQFSAVDYPDGEVLINDEAALRYYGVDYAGNRTGTTTSLFAFNNTMGNVTNPTAVVSDGQITLSWVNPTGTDSTGFTGVKIFRSETTYPDPNDPTSTLIYDSANTTTTSYVDSGLINGTTYYYGIFAYGDATPTNYASGAGIIAVPVDNTPPASVTGFTATGGNQSVALNWTNPTDADFAGVVIRKSTSSAPDSRTAGNLVYDGNETSFTDNNVQNNTTYYYSAFSYDASGNYTINPVTHTAATLDTNAPPPVTDFKANARDGSVQLSWINPTTADFSKVIVRRDTGSFPQTHLSGTGVYDGTGMSIEDTNVTNNTEYLYSAFAIDTTGNASNRATYSALPRAEYLTSTSPAVNATDVAPSISAVTATFTDAINDATIGDRSVVLKDISGTDVPGSVGLYNSTNNIVGLSINENLAIKAPYTATVSNNLTNTSGASLLASPYSWSFVTADGSWLPSGTHLADHAALDLSSTAIASTSSIGMGQNGKGIVVWTQPVTNTNGYYSAIYANAVDVDINWNQQQAQAVSSIGVSTGEPKLAVNSVGDAVVVWTQNNRIWASSYTSTNGWATDPVPIQEDGTAGHSPTVAMNDQGDIAVMWVQSGPSYDDIWASVFTFNNGNLPSLPVQMIVEWDDVKDARSPKVVIDQQGNILAAWAQADASNNYGVEFNRYRIGSGWDSGTLASGNPHPSLGDPDNHSGRYFFDLGMDSSGNAIFVWDNVNTRIWAQTYDFAGDSLGVAEQVGLTGQTPPAQLGDPPVFAMNKSGVALLAFNQDNGAVSRGYINKYEPASGWKTPKIFTTSLGEYSIAMNEIGNALIIMGQSNTMDAYHYSVASDWNALGLIPTVDIESIGDLNRSHSPVIAIDNKGRGIASWSKDTDEVGGYAQLANVFKYRVASPELTITLSNPVANGTAITLDYQISNSGTADASSFDVAFWANRELAPSVGDTGDATITITSLAQGVSTTGTVTVATTLASGTPYALVDSANTVAEMMENNNFARGPSWLSPVRSYGFEGDVEIASELVLYSNPTPNILWFIDTSTGATGSTTSIRSGNIAANNGTCVTTDITDAMQVSFDYKVSSEAGWDFLRFYVDSIEVNSFSGLVDWTNYVYTPTSGTHTLDWCYVKDQSGIGGDDAAWIDNIVIQ